jgi:hypothetical protein
MVAGSATVYSALFGIGNLIYGRYLLAGILLAVAVAGGTYVARVWGRVSGESQREPSEASAQGTGRG